MSFLDTLAKTGRLPPISIDIIPLDGSGKFTLTNFISYQFDSSITVPVDTFSFEMAAPDDQKSLTDYVNEGDIAILYANGTQLATGFVDTIETELDAQYGERMHINGRDMMAFYEDQDSINLDSAPIFAGRYGVVDAIRALSQNTRIPGVNVKGGYADPKPAPLFATEPGESKLSSLQRYLEPLNIIAWMAPDGNVNVGKPNFGAAASGRLVLNKSRRESNVLGMRVSRSSTCIPNIIVPIWVGQELTQNRVSSQNVIVNQATGPNRLLAAGHRVIKSVIVSTPQADSPQALADINAIQNAGANILQAYGKRELAKQNQKEIILQVMVPGHFNEDGLPYVVDTVYHIDFDRGDLNENMYLFHTQYDLSEDGGQRTILWFCRLWSIVADVSKSDTSSLTQHTTFRTLA